MAKEDDGVCSICHESNDVLESALQGKMLGNVLLILKPIQCKFCEERFADTITFDQHQEEFHSDKVSLSFENYNSRQNDCF